LTAIRQATSDQANGVAPLASWLGMALAALTAVAVASPGAAEPVEGPALNQPADCAARYHTRLANDALPKARRTLEVANEMRTKSLEYLPGRWLFWDGYGIARRTRRQKRLLATQIIDRKEQRMCVRPVLVRGGRIRCMQWKPIPAGYVPPPPKLPKANPIKVDITMAERRVAARLSARVISKGAFFELSHGTALYHITKRTTDELIGYTSQPFRRNICSGAPEMAVFYRDRLQPLLDKLADSERQQLAIKKTAISSMRSAIGHPSSMTGSQSSGIAGLLRRLLRKTLTKAEFAELPEKASSIRLLEFARAALTDERLETLPLEQHRQLVKALRSVEFAFYADYNHRHLQRLNASFQAVLGAILRAHSQECPCNQL
jgi:hypothetical protein